MAKIETTTKEFKDGIRLSGDATEIHWESTGHLSVRLLDASGTRPVAGRTATVEIPGEGSIALESDADGKIFHPDVPFQDYELDLGEGVKVHAPAVANRDDVQERHVPKVVFAFARLLVRDDFGLPCADATVSLTGPDGAVLELTTDEDGYLEHDEVLPPGTYKLSAAGLRAEIDLPDHGDGLGFSLLEGDGS